jgi:hypothetical protein
VALNFPNSPTVGQIYTDSTSGFSYEWDGTVWKSYSPSNSSQIKIIDDISGSFNGIASSFALTSNSSSITPPSSQTLIINLGGVVQDPSDDYSVSGSNIIFSTPPQTGLTFSGVSLGPAFPITLTNLNSTDDTTTSGTFYPVFVDGTTNSPAKVSTSKLTYDPSLGKLTATTVNSSSDESLKKDIHTIENAVEKINQLRGVNFTWKDTDEKSAGVIAQELQKVFPELVSKNENGLSINYNGLIGVLIEAIKELSYK